MFFRNSRMKATGAVAVGILAAGCAVAQEQPAPPAQDSQSQGYPAQSPPYPSQTENNGGWAPVGQNPNTQGQPQGPYAQGGAYGAPAPPQNGPYAPAGQQGAPYNGGGQYGPGSSQQAPPPIPSQLSIPGGTFLTVRVNQFLSSDRNQAGDGFSASLMAPLVVNGIVIAEPGETLAGRVTEAQKAGRVQGTSRLRVQMTELTLVDGQQIPLQTQFVSRNGSTSVGRDAGAIAGTTGLGAAIGAAAGSGPGAAIGAGAGAVVGTVGVLLTRGQATVIYPEQTLTFRIEAPVTIDTTRSAQAFRYVQPNEYERPVYNNRPAPYAGYGAPVAVAAAPYYYPYPYSYPYGYGYAPGFSFFFGSGYYRPYYYGRGFSGGYGRYRR